MKSMFNKEIRRSIRNTLGRFIAIAAITALGAGFYAGLRMVAPDMNRAADELYDTNSLFDVRVVSTLGLTDADVAAIKEVELVDQVMPAYTADVMATVQGKQTTLSIHSLNPSATTATPDGIGVDSNDASYLNRLTLTEGEWPTQSGQCVIGDRISEADGWKIGDTITVTTATSDLESTLATTTYTIVGRVTTPYYACLTNLGTTTLGSGMIAEYIYVLPTDFAETYPYTEAFVTVKGAAELVSGSDEYNTLVKKAASRINNIGVIQSAAREAEIKNEYQTELDAQWSTLNSQRSYATSQFYEAEEELDSAHTQLQLAQTAFDAVKTLVERIGLDQEPELAARLAAAQAQLDSAKAEYNAALSEYNRQLASVNGQFSEAESQLNAAQEQLNTSVSGEWYILDRTKHYGTASFASDVDRVENIARIFPFIFFLVAALVCLTTMTRMVEDERVLIGTFKALGYSKMKIASKYLIYGAVAGVIGCVIGIPIMTQVLPIIIMNAYAIMYAIPAIAYPVSVGLVLLSAGLGIGVILVATLAAALSSLREKPASLMLPKAPKAGKRILLERVKPIWNRVSFSWKVTFRNLFLYKKRLIMTIIGIAGCTALMVTGYGLSNAINDIVPKHFGNLLKYNAIVRVDQNIADEQKTQLDALLTNQKYVDDYLMVYKEALLAKPEGTMNLTVEMTVPSDTVRYEDYYVLRERVGHKMLDIEDDGAIINEKLAKMMNVDVGDTIELFKQDAIGNATDTSIKFTVTGICEGYIGSAIFVSPAVYRNVMHTTPAYTSALVKATDDAQLRTEFSDAALAIDGVKVVSFNDESVDYYKEMLKSIDSIVLILVICAAILAFIVLYNLTNINISERIREIATLKVLGFTPREVQSYIFREIAILTVISAILGLFLGYFMANFVIISGEVDQVMFGRDIHFTSYLYSFLFTLVFSAIVMLFMRKKLTKVNMVESLKSIE